MLFVQLLQEKIKKQAPLSLEADDLLLWQKKIQNQLPPHRKDEDWKYADVSFLKKENFEFPVNKVANCLEYDGHLKKLRLLIRNCQPEAELTISSDLCPGIEVLSRTQWLKSEYTSVLAPSLKNEWKYSNYFSDASYSLASQNTLLIFGSQFPEDVSVDIIFDGSQLPTGSVHTPHVLCLLKSGSTVRITERYLQPENSFIVSGIDYYIQDNSDLECLKLEDSPESTRHIHTSRFSLARDARLRLVTLTQDNYWSRHNCYIELTQSGAHADLLGAYIALDQNFIDHHTWIDHQVPHTTSSQQYHGVVTGRARAVFNGKIKIHKDAQKSATSQINKNLLLSSAAEIDAKPELIILADDVKASHGATIGQIQKDELFYLLSRGLNLQKSKELLCSGFLNTIGDSLSEELSQNFKLSVQKNMSRLVEEEK